MREISPDSFRKYLLVLPERAIEYLFEIYFDRLVHMSVWKTGSRKASEDIVLDAFTTIWHKSAELAVNEDFIVAAWLFTFVKNKSISHFKKSTNEQRNLTLYFAANPDFHNENVEKEMITWETSKAIWRIVTDFPPREKQCLLMKHYLCLSLDEIALDLNISRKAVERSLTSANKRLGKHKSLFS